MESYQARLDSFCKSKRIKQSTARSSSAVSVKWSHPSNYLATPTTLAEAGFYFAPSWNDRDNVRCFSCSKELSDWGEDDDPIHLHWKKCKDTCAWAVVRCGLEEDMDGDGNYIFEDSTRLPGSKTMEKARLATFASLWPHDNVKNHGATSNKLAGAGFVYTPQHPGDDTATCVYCSISLNGWNDDDDPLQEHKKREKNGVPCPFFTHARIKGKGASKPPSRAKGKKAVPVNPDPEGESGPIRPPPSKARGKPAPTPSSEEESPPPSKPPPSTRALRGRKVPLVKEQQIGPEDEPLPLPKNAAGKRAPSRQPSRKTMPVEVVETEEKVVEPPPPVKRAPSSRQPNRKTIAATESDREEVIAAPSKPPASKRAPSVRAQSRQPSRKTPIVADSEDEVTVVPSKPPASKRAPSVRATSRQPSRKRLIVADSEDEEAVTPQRSKSPTSNRTPSVRASSRQPSKKVVPVELLSGTGDELGIVEALTAPPKKTNAKGKAVVDSEVESEADQVLAKSTRGRKKTAEQDMANKEVEPVVEKGKKAVVEDMRTKAPTRSKSRANLGSDSDSTVLNASKPKPKKSKAKAKAKTPGRSKSRAPSPLATDVTDAQGGGTNDVSKEDDERKAKPIQSKAERGVPEPIEPEPAPEPLPLPPPEQVVAPPPKSVKKRKKMAAVVQVVEEEHDQDMEIDEGGRGDIPVSSMDDLHDFPASPSPAPALATSAPTAPPDCSIPVSGFELPALFFPPLATGPTLKFDSTTEEQMDMTVEQWIRYEIGLQFEQFEADGRRRLGAYMDKAAQVRKAIETL